MYEAFVAYSASVSLSNRLGLTEEISSAQSACMLSIAAAAAAATPNGTNLEDGRHAHKNDQAYKSKTAVLVPHSNSKHAAKPASSVETSSCLLDHASSETVWNMTTLLRGNIDQGSLLQQGWILMCVGAVSSASAAPQPQQGGCPWGPQA